jgi:hypothetical protein
MGLIDDDRPPMRGARRRVAFLTEPVGQSSLQLVEPQKPVGGLAGLGRGAGHGADRVDQFGLLHHPIAVLALVAEGLGRFAERAGPLDEAIGQKLPGFEIVELAGGSLGEQALLMNLQEEVLAELLMRFGKTRLVCPAVYIKVNSQSGERLALRPVVARGEFFDRDILLARALQRGHAVVVATTNEAHVATPGPQIAHVNIGWQIRAGDVPDVQPIIGIRQCRRNQILR